MAGAVQAAIDAPKAVNDLKQQIANELGVDPSDVTDEFLGQQAEKAWLLVDEANPGGCEIIDIVITPLLTMTHPWLRARYER